MTDQESFFPMMSMEEFEAMVEEAERDEASRGLSPAPIIEIPTGRFTTVAPWSFFVPNELSPVFAASLGHAGFSCSVENSYGHPEWQRDGTLKRGMEALRSMGLPDWVAGDYPAIVETNAHKACIAKAVRIVLSSEQVRRWAEEKYRIRPYNGTEWESGSVSRKSTP